MDTFLIQLTGTNISDSLREAIREQVKNNPDGIASIVWYDESQKHTIEHKLVYKQHIKPLKEVETFLNELIRSTS